METSALFGRYASKLLSLDTVFRGVQSALRKTLVARRALERNVERVLAGANLPSARDVERVLVQVKELDHQIADISERIERLRNQGK
jgi:hypothetical protein